MAVQPTGWGELIMKVLLAKTATDLIGAGHDPMAAARAAIDILARRVGGLGGCILLDAPGGSASPSTPHAWPMPIVPKMAG